jgi:transcriptional regulator with PAS, ATPase and Fis domain
MGELVELVRRIAKVDATVLITGESGTGKERIARLIHDESTRAGGPFVAVNCAAITETLLESELFGHARGAFTGASHDRAGLFEAANGGTLLLDEVGEIPAGMQVKLLRVLQEREVRRVGENKSRPINVRVLSATNRDLVHGVAGGAFRQDLYYRLKVVEAHVPSLRDRTADILPLASALLGAAARRMKRDVSGFSPTAIELLLHYGWPGNVRELENAMERAAALAKGSMVEERDLPEELRAIITVPPLDPNVRALAGIRPLAEIEKDYIVAALARNGGNQTHTAQQLKIGSATLYRKLRSYGMTSPRVPAGERKN